MEAPARPEESAQPTKKRSWSRVLYPQVRRKLPTMRRSVAVSLETEQPSEQQHCTKTSQYAENAAPGHDASELTTENGAMTGARPATSSNREKKIISARPE
jgi:hypothetical protein